MRARRHYLSWLPVAALALALTACGGGSSGSTSGSPGSGSGSGDSAQQAVAKVSAPATPPILPKGFPLGSWKNAKAGVDFRKNGLAKVTLDGKAGNTQYSVSDNSITFNNDDAGVCDSPATYTYKATSSTLKLTLTTVDLCSARSADFSGGPFSKG